MKSEFYETYQNYSKDKLFEIVLTPDDYQPAAVIAAIQLITEKKWKEELDKKLEEEQELYEADIKEKAEYYKNAVEFKSQRNSFQVTVADIPKFESALADKGIEFFREDKNLSLHLVGFPTKTYFFKNEDVEAVNKITKDLGLMTSAYSSTKSFARFEIKVLIIALVVIFILYMLIKAFA